MSAPRIPVADRIHDKYVVDLASGCWQWTASTSRGYARIDVDGHSRQAHRVMYELLVGPIPGGLVLDHLCRNTRCVNPAHMEPVTDRENILRSTCPPALNARATHCKRGHEFTPENTRRRGNGSRYCRACDRARYHEQKAAA